MAGIFHDYLSRPSPHKECNSLPIFVHAKYFGNIDLTMSTWLWGVSKQRWHEQAALAFPKISWGTDWGASICEQSLSTQKAFITMPRYEWYPPGKMMWFLHSSDPNVLPYRSPPEPLGQQALEPVLALALSCQHYFKSPWLLQILI